MIRIAIFAVVFCGPLVIALLAGTDLMGPDFRLHFDNDFQSLRFTWTEIAFPRQFLNSTILVAIALPIRLVGTFLLAATLAYVRGSRFMVYPVLLGMLVPEQVIFVPVYIGIAKLALYDSLMALVIPNALYGFGVIFLMTAMRDLPEELGEAALMDGVGFGRWCVDFALPIFIPHLVAIAVISAIDIWNEYFWARSLLASADSWPVQVGVGSLLDPEVPVSSGVVMAAVSSAILPVIVLTIVFARSLMLAFEPRAESA